MKVLITGSKGQLGCEFKVLKNVTVHELIFVDRDTLDITNQSDIDLFCKRQNIKCIINCAAYTAVDDAEDYQDKAFAVNEKAVKNLVKVCENQKIKLIHFSTDYVFNGENHKPYTESDKVNPIGVYGKSKRAGEEVILKSQISSLIIRTSWLYSEFGHNFMKSMIKLGRERDELRIVYDQVGTPTNALDLAMAVLGCIDQHKKWKNRQEVYHFSNEGVASWYDFALAIFEKENISCEVKPILSKDYPTKAERPHYSVLDKTKLKTDFKLDIPHWLESLKSI